MYPSAYKEKLVRIYKHSSFIRTNYGLKDTTIEENSQQHKSHFSKLHKNVLCDCAICLQPTKSFFQRSFRICLNIFPSLKRSKKIRKRRMHNFVHPSLRLSKNLCCQGKTIEQRGSLRGQGPPQIKIGRSSSTRLIGIFCSSRAVCAKKRLETFSLPKKSYRDFFGKLKDGCTFLCIRLFRIIFFQPRTLLRLNRRTKQGLLTDFSGNSQFCSLCHKARTGAHAPSRRCIRISTY